MAKANYMTQTNDTIIQIRNIGKRYNINHQRGGYIALRDVFSSALKNPFSFAIKKVKDITGINKTEEYWALKDINLDIKRGEVIGIIGKNGAGKSTLLKILSQITPPTEGEITLRGSVGSLLEVGTGFHPELTGRENIFLNGAILGMTRSNIIKKFDDIVEFAGISQFLDTPVKYYSSGMYVRLAFSVAAHMEPDILIIDEVLAVGDAEFQKKCLGKMEEVTRQDGRTIIFVSHNMNAIQKLCRKTALLEKGKIVMYGETDKVVEYYLENKNSNPVMQFENSDNKDAYIKQVRISCDNKNVTDIPINKEIIIDIQFEVLNDINKATLCLMFSNSGNEILHTYESDYSGSLKNFKKGSYETRVTIPAFTFNVGSYDTDILLDNPGINIIDRVNNISFKIIDENNPKTKIMSDNTSGVIGIIPDYQTKQIQ